MRGLADTGMVETLRTVVASGRPFLGVCIGLQVLMTSSDENGGSACLDIVQGTTRHLPGNVKAPHMGWNQVHLNSDHPLFEGIPNDSYFYFVHSYAVVPTDSQMVLGVTDHGGNFCSVLAKDNLTATQFHPEKSGDLGLQIYANFVRLAA